ncbi:unnamed protein product [Victoria cruziana]
MNDKGQMMNRSYGGWHGGGSSGPTVAGGYPQSGRAGWKPKKVDKRRKGSEGVPVAPQQGVVGYNPPRLQELQTQNRLKARRFYPKRKFHRFAPYAPRNTTSFIIRAKKSGGIASLVSPCPVTPAILPTPVISPSREGLIDMAKEEWGVDGYGSMNGLIRLRSPGNEENRDETGTSSDSESDVEEHVEVERRLDHDLSRFEMIYPSGFVGDDESRYENLLESKVDDQDALIAQLEEENLTLKERLFLMEQEIVELRRRLRIVEADRGEANNEEVSGNEGGGDISSEKSVGDGEPEVVSCADVDGVVSRSELDVPHMEGSQAEAEKSRPEEVDRSRAEPESETLPHEVGAETTTKAEMEVEPYCACE